VIASHLPGEAAEAIIDLATGTTPTKPEVRQPDQSNPFEHPDAQRRFRVLTGTEELARALDYPWERWIVFLEGGRAGRPRWRQPTDTGRPAAGIRGRDPAKGDQPAPIACKPPAASGGAAADPA
jgi:hypothetical protein